MARDFAAVNLAIWQDSDWRDLPADAKLLYLTLWTHPQLSRAGVVDWRPGRLAALIDTSWTVEHFRTVANCLEARLFIVTDEQTEECPIRSWVRFDGLMKSPIMSVTFANDYAAVVSTTIREVIVHEMIRLREREPDLVAWKKDRVLEVLDMPSRDPRDRGLPTDGLTPALTHSVTPALTHSVTVNGGVGGNPSPNHPPTPSPSPTPITPAPRNFDAFWETYPRRADKKKAIAAYAKAIKRADEEAILAGARRYRDDPNREQQFTKLPTTWLNGDCWDDEPLPPRSGSPSQPEIAPRQKRVNQWRYN